MGRSSLRGWMVLVVLLSTMAYAMAEQFTLVSYMPAPRGIYSELRSRDGIKIGNNYFTNPNGLNGGLIVEGDSAFGATGARAGCKLDVQTGNICVTLNAAIDQNLTVGGNATITRSLTTGPTTVTGATTINTGPLAVNGATILNALTTAGPNILNGTTTIANLSVTGLTVGSGGLTVTGPTTLNTVTAQSITTVTLVGPTNASSLTVNGLNIQPAGNNGEAWVTQGGTEQWGYPYCRYQ